MLDGNTIWLTTDFILEDNIKVYKEEIKDFKTDKPSSSKISSLKKNIEDDRKAAIKLKATALDKEYDKLLADLEEIAKAKQSKPEPVVEQETIEESSTETFSMPEIGTQNNDSINTEEESNEEIDS